MSLLPLVSATRTFTVGRMWKTTPKRKPELGWRIKRPELVSVFASNWGAKRGGTRAGHLAQRTRTLIFQPYH